MISRGRDYPATFLRVLRDLGLAQVAAFARYQLLKRSGLLWRRSQGDIARALQAAPPAAALGVFPLPDAGLLNSLLSPASREAMEFAAAEVCAGQVRLFDGPPAALNFTPPLPLSPWPQHESQTWLPAASAQDAGASTPSTLPPGLDIKFLWEPARFGWALQLARAAHLSADPQGNLQAAFWQHTSRFLEANPPGMGPHWASAQEVALRLVSLCLAWEVFGPACAPGQAAMLAAALAAHAARIPASLDYARAQNNNHRLSEAAALYTAALYLPSHPQAAAWRRLGWQEFHAGLRSQVRSTGEYCQHSANYHRLMLQLALWMHTLAARQGEAFPAESLSRLAAASRWLAALLDEPSGRLPNLGPNDGAYILPLASAPYHDYRPVLQSAWQAFCAAPLLPPGEWDEMAAWFSLPVMQAGKPGQSPSRENAGKASPHVLRANHSWAFLRAAHFSSRPGHADQLHLDLWWRGLNLAQDAGTYLYNAPPPWDNRLAGAEVHNTLTANNQDQMQRAGRFLYLAPAQVEITEMLRSPDGRFQRLAARHLGYRRLGLLHVRGITLTVGEAGEEWLVEDQLVAAGAKEAAGRLHWLLPDLPWSLETAAQAWELTLQAPQGSIRLQLAASLPGTLTLGRAGKVLAGDGEMRPAWGWSSPTYGQLVPALSLAVQAAGSLPLSFRTRWILPA